MYYVGIEWFGKWPIFINFDLIKQLTLYCKLHFRFILSLIGDNDELFNKIWNFPGLFLFCHDNILRTNKTFFVSIRFRIISFYFFLRMKKTLDVILGHAIKCLTLRALIRNEFFFQILFFFFQISYFQKCRNWVFEYFQTSWILCFFYIFLFVVIVTVIIKLYLENNLSFCRKPLFKLV